MRRDYDHVIYGVDANQSVHQKEALFPRKTC